MLELWFNKFLECLFSSTLVILETEMAVTKISIDFNVLKG